MEAIQTSAGEMSLVGGRLCLDFVNTVDGRNSESAQNANVLGDKLAGYSDLVEWSRHSGIVTATEAERLMQAGKQNARDAQGVFDRSLALREALYRTFKATMKSRRPQPADMEIVNDELQRARTHERLTYKANAFKWEWVDRDAALDRMLWSIAQSAAELLTTGDFSRLRECCGDKCGWLFEDISRNRSRQWCDMQVCGNLAKVRRYRTRARRGSKEIG
jgi:predicted RNA-binding Zn ribbon-like protein